MARSLRGKIDSLYQEWSTVVTPSDILHELLGNKENARSLFHGLRRQVKAIRQRSQTYEDGQITIYDAVLVQLYEKGHTMQAYGLFDFYLAEFLGTKDCHSDGEIKAHVTAHLVAQRILDNGPLSEIPILDTQLKPTDQDLIGTQASDSICGSEVLKPVHLQKLIDTYQKAKDDYHVLKVTESHGKRTNNVRFLRDTAENLLRYLKAVNKEHDMIPELEEIVKSSQAQATLLAGGRKRKFERDNSGSRGSLSPSRYRPYRYYGGAYGGYDRHYRWDRYVPENERDHSRGLDSYRP